MTLKLMVGQKAKAIASDDHMFKDGQEIEFVDIGEDWSDGQSYVFKGQDEEGKFFAQSLIEGEFSLLQQ